MTQHEIYSKIKKSRLNKKKREDRPFHNFQLKTQRSQKLLQNILVSISDKTCVKEALSQYVISDITALEVYFKDVFLEIFDFFKDDKELLMRCSEGKLVEKNFSVEDLIIINREKIKIPEIILGHQNFQNLSSINKVFSTIVGEDLFELLNKNKFHRGEPEDFTVPLRSDWYPMMKEYLDLRHTLTHDYTLKSKIDSQRIRELHNNLECFVIAMDICIFYNFIKPRVETEIQNKKRSKKPIKNSSAT